MRKSESSGRALRDVGLFGVPVGFSGIFMGYFGAVRDPIALCGAPWGPLWFL